MPSDDDRTVYRGARPSPVRRPFRRGHIDASMMPLGPEVFAAVSEAAPVLHTSAQSFVGVTEDGVPRPDLFGLRDEGLSTAVIAGAARAWLDCLDADHRRKAVLSVEAVEWQHWINAFLTFPEHGVLLDELGADRRGLAMDLVRATVSAAGMDDIRTAMRLNARLGELCAGYEDTLKEYMYWLTIFGEPSETEPWGWQLMGHHLDLNCLIVGGQVVLTPSFLGTEFDGHELFAEHIKAGVRFMDALNGAQRDRAVAYRSIRNADLPPHLAGPINGRHVAGAGQDNLVLPYEGLSGDSLDREQRTLLRNLVRPYLRVLPDGSRLARQAEIDRHLDVTHVLWMGGWGDGEPFYYRVHSPVILIEYDNHSGVFLDNPEPQPYHVHTIVRTPNGNDYGKDLLARHYAAAHHR
ncbi:DUF3500 domain-containing protein [Embleya scabrispora]|uniref:DUF3500 domain-containing protein n=1 Tax=Embleya scabrispora TaxID=159449 RepID=UPI000373C83E|nr:DUF3500 domain-containing protein [Embleya scabrispora]MYS79213.1 DUF3500 domain-containing protein [Streptomyces sp. SID5474]